MAKRMLAVKNLNTPVMCGHPIVEKSEVGYRCLKCLEVLTEAQVKQAGSRIVAEKEALFVDFVPAS